MRYRPLSPLGDYTINTPWYVNSPTCVGQLVETRLRLFLGEWFMDTSDGVPYLPNNNTSGSVLGRGSGVSPDAYIKQRILSTFGVSAILTYTSQLTASRAFTCTSLIDTIYSVNGVSTTTVTVTT